MKNVSFMEPTIPSKLPPPPATSPLEMCFHSEKSLFVEERENGRVGVSP